MLRSLLIAVLLAAPLAAQTPAEVAALVEEPDAAVLAPALAGAIASPVALTRATAARVTNVRNVAALLPQLRERLAVENDPMVVRELARALVIAGDPSDVDAVIAATRPLPRGIDGAIAQSVARRSDAFELIPKLHAAKIAVDSSFMTLALWQRPIAAVGAGARFVARADAASWRALLAALRQSHLAMAGGVLSASLNSPSEEIRNASVWYLVHGFGSDPSQIDPLVLRALASPAEPASTREAFGRELLRRMSGGEKKSDPAWLEWLQSPEADDLIGSEESLFVYFTDDEYLIRKKHCGIATNECRVPVTKPGKTIPSTSVKQPEFVLPSVLPAGLADAIVAGAGCKSAWLALAAATADRGGRVQTVDLKRITIDDRCARAVTLLMKLSVASPVSITAPAKSTDVLLVRSARVTPCLDEASVDEVSSQLYRVGNEVKAPQVVKRVEPHFPDSARWAMHDAGGKNVLVIAEMIISRTGCVRSLRLLVQSPYAELNGAAVEALSQWTFAPGRLAGVPVEVIFNLTINFKLN